MDQDADSPPTFWLQPPLTSTRRRGTPFSPIIDPVVLIIVVPILALLFLFFFLPPFLTHTSHILKPGSVKSTWDSLNIFLVLFAIICGVLARKNDDVSNSGDVNGIPVPMSNDGAIVQSSGLGLGSGSGSGQWVGFSDRKVGTGGLRRSSSSYPDLRQESLWENGENRYRYFDDFGVDMYSSPAARFYGDHSRRIDGEREDLYRSTPVAGEIYLSSRRSEADPGEFSDVKEIVVDTFEVSPNASDSREPPESMEPVLSPEPASPPAPEPSVPAANSKRHSFRSVGRNVKVEIPSKIESDEFHEIRSYPRSPPPAPPPPPPLPAARMRRSHHKHKKLERKVSDATKEIATAISSLYNQKKRKSKRKMRNISVSSDSSPPSVHSMSSPETRVPPEKVVPAPPPPPPPPPPSMFHNIFKKGSKHKKIHSVPATISPAVPPPPPPPPPPSSIFNNLFKSGNKSKRFHSPATAPPPPPPPPSSIMNSLFKNSTKSKRFNSFRAASPPPPPPPPPMTPPRYSFPVKSKPESTRKNKPQPPPRTKPEPHRPRPASSGKPPLPTKSNNYYDRDDFLQSGSQSPLIPMPPPPPPFKMPAMKFELRGDFVRIRSTHSSVCSSPDREDVDFPSTIIDGGDSIGPGFGPGPVSFPSPDVNAKADSFISRLKDEWRMEKINYVKEKMG